MKLLRPVFSFAVIFSLSSGCAHYPLNEPKSENSEEGYYLRNHSRTNNSEELIFLLAFSGGGTRAASFSYGLLEALRDTTYAVDGENRSLLDEIDVISSVSGGSFTAAAYALYGDEIFEKYKPQFLNRDVQGSLIYKGLNPFNWPALWSGTYGMSDLAAEYYDKILFHGATFSDLQTNNAPFIVINTTDVASGNRLSFNQDMFDIIGSDVGPYPLARAVAASSAVPGLLSPVTLRNFAGAYELQRSPWRDADYSDPVAASARAHAQRLALYDNSTEVPYVHMVDGSVSDNLGLRCYLDSFSLLVANPDLIKDHPLRKNTRRIVLISVNSFAHQTRKWERSEKPPGAGAVKKAAGNRTRERYSEDSLADMRRLIGELKKTSENEDGISLYFIELDFHRLKDPTLANQLLSLPTTLRLNEKTVDELRHSARLILYESADFKRLVSDLGAEYPDKPAPVEKRRWWQRRKAK